MMTKRQIERAIEKFKKGHDSAFETLYEATKKRVYYTLLSLLKNPSDVDDVMQETYLKVIEKIHAYQTGTYFEAWVNQIARNTGLDYLRKQQATEPLDEVDYNPHLRVDSTIEKRLYVKSLLDSLDETDREIVIRKALLDEKHKDIAKALNMPLGTVTWRYQQAIKKLKEKEEASDE